MAEVVLFHHALGITPGVRELAERLRSAGHAVRTPDLFEGRTFDNLDAGVAHVEEIGVDKVLALGRAAVANLPESVVYVGLSLGVMPAQMLAQTRPGAKGAVLIHACVPAGEFGDGWPAGVPVQIHGMDADPFFAGEGDINAARALVDSTADAELFIYPGDKHLFTDPSLPDHDAEAAGQVMERMLAFLDRTG